MYVELSNGHLLNLDAVVMIAPIGEGIEVETANMVRRFRGQDAELILCAIREQEAVLLKRYAER